MTGKTILVTGAEGFIGRSVVAAFSDHRVIACDIFQASQNDLPEHHCREILDLRNGPDIRSLLHTYCPDVVIHCAGIAHQKLRNSVKADYFVVNTLGTAHLAEAAAEANPGVHFIFLSSISVYGETHGDMAVTETDVCIPTSDYAESKLDAEIRLQTLYGEGKLKKLDMLRLAPVYDKNFCINIEKRVYAPKKLFFLKFGSGEQKMSVLSLENLVGLIRSRVGREDSWEGGREGKNPFCETFNVCDKDPVTFKQIIDIFKQSRFQPTRVTIPIPLCVVKGMVNIAGYVLTARSSWISSCYDKLAADLVFDNGRMLQTGFQPKASLRSVFLQ